MAKQPFDKPDPIDPQQLAEDVHAFMLSDLGLHYMTVLQTKYNEQHHKAEIENMTNEQRGWHIAYAAGVKFGLDWMVQRNQQHESGYYDKK